MSHNSQVEIRVASSAADRLAFIRLPWSLYDQDAYWVPPVIADQKEFLDPKRGSFFEYGKAKLFLAYRGEKLIGRISAQTNSRYEHIHDPKKGFMGFFECEDSEETVQALTNAAEGWLKAQGKTTIEGPYSFSIYDEIGIQLDSFETAPYVMTVHNRPYYAALLESQGYSKQVDWYAYRVTYQDCFESLPKKYARVYGRIIKQGNMTLRRVNVGKGFTRDAEIIQDIFNDAWNENWGHVPLTDREFRRIAKFLRLVSCPELSLIAEVDGRPAGCSIVLYDANEVVKKMNGKLYPFGFLKLLWGLKKTNRARLIIMGMREQYRGKGYDLGFYLHLIEQSQGLNLNELELSVVVETNRALLQTLDKLPGVERYKTYRIFQKSLA